MIIKEAASRDRDVEVLGEIAGSKNLPAATKAKVEEQIRAIKVGAAGEKDSAYHIDFTCKHSNKIAVIHDLRLDVGGRIAQIDHIVLHWTLVGFVCETKNYNAGLAVAQDGDFTAFYGKNPRAIPSPAEQNRKHIAVLTDLFKASDFPLPTRLGLRMQPDLKSLIMVSPKSRITVEGIHDGFRIIKADAFHKMVDEHIGKIPITQMAKTISSDSLRKLAEALAARHVPLEIDWYARFGLTRSDPEPSVDQPVAEGRGMICEGCAGPLSKAEHFWCIKNKAKYAGKRLCRGCQPHLFAKTGQHCAPGSP